MPNVTLINVLSVDPANQAKLIESLKENTRTVITTLDGWRSTRLIAAADGAKVVIHSEWSSQEAVAAMRADPRMQAYFPKVLELASLDSTVGEVVFSESAQVPA